MSRILTIDIGAGTMDVLYFDTASGLHYKAVVESPVRTTARRVRAAEGKLLVTGVEMGGGAVSQALKARAASGPVLISRSAAMTLSHDTARTEALGLTVIDDERALELASGGQLTHITLADLELDRIKRLIETFGVDFEFDVVGICVQDHGLAPAGVSSLDYRHNHFRGILDAHPSPDALLYHGDDVPRDMPRLRAVSDLANRLPAPSIFVMDSGMAAILGATLDARARTCQRVIVLDVATSHTVAATFEGDELCAFVEYHTRDIEADKVDSLLQELADGQLEHARVLAEGGHGAYTRRALGFDSVELIVATGPKRALLTGSNLDMVLGAPLGDNMMTGALGLLEAIRRREGWDVLAYDQGLGTGTPSARPGDPGGSAT